MSVLLVSRKAYLPSDLKLWRLILVMDIRTAFAPTVLLTFACMPYPINGSAAIA